MVWPKVSVIWLNYNSTKFINIVLRSLEAVTELNYPSDRYELIVVDNGSTDGSFEKIKDFLQGVSLRNKIKIIRLERNLGFTGGNNLGFKARDPESSFVALLNNDAIPFSDSLSGLIEFMEAHENVGAVQGILVDLESRRVDTAGDMLTELLVAYQLYHNRPAQSVGRSFYISYADGAYSIFKVEAVKKAVGIENKMFYEEMFAYFDDSVLGLQLWNAGFKVLSCPIMAALHRRSSSFGTTSAFRLYLMTRGYIALNEISNSVFKSLIRTTFPMRILKRSVISLLTSKLAGGKYRLLSSPNEVLLALYKGYEDGVRWGRNKLREMKSPLDIYKAPILRLPVTNNVAMLLTGVGMDFAKKFSTEYITKKFENEILKFIAVKAKQAH
ncbi:MAG: glycosyltransferase family 2 protein [Candidatus Bathyarchaeia archaeon]